MAALDLCFTKVLPTFGAICNEPELWLYLMDQYASWTTILNVVHLEVYLRDLLDCFIFPVRTDGFERSMLQLE